MPDMKSPQPTLVDPQVLARLSFDDLRLVAKSIGFATLVAAVFTIWYAVQLAGWSFALQIVWAVGIWCAGMGLGFLFGIPKVLQGSVQPASTATSGTGTPSATDQTPTPSTSTYQQRVNTNLEDISDWLTKIIVGVTLVQLKEIPGLMNSLADAIVSNLLPAGNHRGFGLAIIVVFSVLGFLFGYLVTRLYIQGALARAERGLSGEGTDLESERRRSDVLTALLDRVTQQIPSAPAASVDGPPENVRKELEDLANQYKSVKIDDWKARTKAKSDIAAKLCAFAIANSISRDWLCRQGDEALVLAYAGIVQAAPTKEDTARLLMAGSKISRLHVQYWILLAFTRLLEADLTTSKERTQISALLDQYEKNADESLKQRIAMVRRML